MFGALSGIVHVDGKGSRLGRYLLPAGDTISEPVFVERARDAAEGDGWLLAAVWRAGENRSDLAVFNAGDVDAGPVALVQLGTGYPTGFTAIGWGLCEGAVRLMPGPRAVIPGRGKASNHDVQLHIGESREYTIEIPGSSLRDAPE